MAHLAALVLPGSGIAAAPIAARGRPGARLPTTRPVRCRRAAASASLSVGPDRLAAWNEASDRLRAAALESQLRSDLLSVLGGTPADPGGAFRVPVLTTALIAGDMVLLDAIAGLGLLKSRQGTVEVMFIDTLHLFAETVSFLAEVEAHYGFTARRYMAAGCSSRRDWNKLYGSDLFMTDVEKYDAAAKVEPLGRGLAELGADLWINGRRRDHGAERSALLLLEPGAPPKFNPLAHWTFADCFAYLDAKAAPRHPLHAAGYPSLGDVHSTSPVPRDKWFAYGGERSGRFQALVNADGSAKTECGIHAPGAAGAGSPVGATSSMLRPPGGEAAASSSLLRPKP